MKKRFYITMLILILLATVVFAMTGYIFYYGYAFDDAVYATLQLFAINSNAIHERSIAVNIARFLAPVVIIAGVTQLLYVISQNGWRTICLLTFNNHTIVCGYGDTGKTIATQLEQMGRKHIVIIDPIIKESKITFSHYYINKYATDVEVLEDAKIARASEIIIATGDDYANTLIYNISKYYEKLSSAVRIEQLSNPEGIKLPNRNTIVFSPSDIVVNEIEQYQNKQIVVLGIGNVGRKIVGRYIDNNNILVIEQSEIAIHMAKDSFNSINVKYVRADIKGLVESDVIRILEKYGFNNHKQVILFICLGGDWLDFKIAWTWLCWKKLALDIHVIGVNIKNEDLLYDKGLGRVTVYNINNKLKDYCKEGKLII